MDSSFLTTTAVGGRPLISPEICAQIDPPFFEHNDFDQYLLIVPGEKVQLTLIGSRPHAFQRALDKSCTLYP